MSIHIGGLDLGQAQDYSALVIIEVAGSRRNVTRGEIDRETGLPFIKTGPIEMMPLVQCDVRHVERFPLQTKYTAIAHQMRGRLAGMPAPRYFAVDKTGVGAGVIEMMAGLSPIGITITSGADVRCVGEQQYHVPKRDLVTAAQIISQNRVLKIAKGLPHGDLLMKEMMNFRTKISTGGHDSYEAWREADHDDLVLALAIGIWTAEAIISVNALGQLGKRRRRDPPSISPY